MNTPMLRQYQAFKEEHPGCLLLMRVGDFYEAYGDDAETVGRALDIVVTRKDAGGGTRVPMSGVPYFAVDGYLRSLIAKGFRVAIADQMESASAAKGLVRREVVRVLSSGTVLDPQLLDERRHNYIVCIVQGSGGRFGLACADVSTGQVVCSEVSDMARLQEEMVRWGPSEVIMAQALPELADICEREGIIRTPIEALTSIDVARKEIHRHYGVAGLEGFGLEGHTVSLLALASLLRYVGDTQRASAAHLAPPHPYSADEFLQIDRTTSRNLELVETFIGRERRGSLLWAMDATCTAMGARMLRTWLERPLMSLASIRLRHDAIDELVSMDTLTEALREHLKRMLDMPRLISRVVYGTANGRDLLALYASLEALEPVHATLSELRSDLIGQLQHAMDPLPDVRHLISEAIHPECPVSIRDGNLIRDGYHAELDELRAIRKGTRSLISEMEERERARSGIKSLKIGYNQVFGYYIEVTRSNLGQVPADYVRKQTLANGERFISPELKEYEARYLSAQERILELEAELFTLVRSRVGDEAPRIRRTAEALAAIDVLCGLAHLAVKHHYCRPDMTEEPVLHLQASRHPVLEQSQDHPFVPNDVYLDARDKRLVILTGPNMAGKSTYLRQAVLIAVMAQMGSFVPAASARIGLCDRVFTRVGASDDLRLGRSTFLVEMAEAANILNNATGRSLVVLDEVGRGTSTHDGLSLAWAIAEHLHNSIGARTLFATHYHELTELARVLDGALNYRVAVRETGRDVVFLHRILPGTSDRSYGVHVARLAGVPEGVLQRAEELLEDFDRRRRPRRKAMHERTASEASQLELPTEPPAPPPAHPLLDEIRSFDIAATTPLQALICIQEWQSRLSGE